jgi:predicted RNase H-like HicB family nuclease
MKYSAVIHKDKGTAFGVSFPDFKGCITYGDTYEEAKLNAKEALEFHVEGMREDGETLPNPIAVHKLMQNEDYSDGALFFVDVGPEIKDELVRINISIHKSKLMVIDEKASRSHMNRSAYIESVCS